MKKKRIIPSIAILMALTAIMIVLTGCTTSEEIPVPTVKKDVYIYDEDNAIDDKVEAKLNKMLVELENKTGAEFVVVSVQDLQGKSIESYSNELFNKLGIGKKDKDNGVLLLFSSTDIKVRLEIGRGLEGCLTDGKCGKILDDYFVPYRSTDKYTKATEETVKAVLNVLAKEYGVNIKDLKQAKSGRDSKDELTPEAIVTGIIFFIIIVAIIIILLEGSGGSSGGYGGGSYGGFYGGGNGFSSRGGSFGGGFSGGGGASR